MNLMAGNIGALFAPKRTGWRLGEIVISDSPSGNLDFSSYDSFSIEFWICTKQESFQVIDKTDDGAGYTIEISDGRINFTIGNGKSWIEKQGKIRVSDNHWHHVVCIRDIHSGLSVYVDSERDGLIVARKAKSLSLANSSPLFIGGANGDIFDIALVRFFGIAVCKKGVEKLRSLNVPDKLLPSLRAEYLFNDKQAKTVCDTSGNDCNGKLIRGTKLLHLAEVVLDESLDITNGTNRSLFLKNDNVGSVRLFLDGKKQFDDRFFFTPGGRLRLLSKTPNGTEITASYKHFPILQEIGGFADWKISYDMHPKQCGSASGYRKYRNTEITWELKAESFWIICRDKKFPITNFIMKAINGEVYLSMWGYDPRVIGPNRERSKIIDNPVTFTGNGVIGTEKRR